MPEHPETEAARRDLPLWIVSVYPPPTFLLYTYLSEFNDLGATTWWARRAPLVERGTA